MTCCGALFGCFWLSNTQNLPLEPNQPELQDKSIVTDSDSDNLLVDEGANYQQDLWEQVVKIKRKQIQQCPPQVDVEGKEGITPEAFLQTLTAMYNTNGFAARVPKLREIFVSTEPFISAVNKMAK
jgi:hypothetical protein